MLLTIPREIIVLILSKIDAPSAFFNIIQTCKIIYSLAPIQQKRKEFLKEVIEIEHRDVILEQRIFTILPNKQQEGPYKVYQWYDKRFGFVIFKWDEFKLCEEFHLDSEYYYINGKLEGKGFIYHSDNVIHIEYDFKDGMLNGFRRQYDNNRRIIGEEYYINDRREGIQKYWNHKTKYFIYREVEMKNDEYDGILVEYKIQGENKILIRKETYINDEAHGPYKTWDYSGRLTSLGEMRNGKEFGSQYEWEYELCEDDEEPIYFWDEYYHKDGRTVKKYFFELDDNDEFILKEETIEIDGKETSVIP